jgi:hypothetical protein
MPSELIQILAVATLTVLGRHLWQGGKGFSLWDEGFLWYGAQRVMKGEVPIRDFCAYDPARYYWSGGLMRLWGSSGPMALRRSVALFQIPGLLAALFLISMGTSRTALLELFLSSITLIAWMHPWYRIFDNVAPILVTGSLALLIQDPTNAQFFWSGAGLGLAAIVGRNHGVYGAGGFALGMAWLGLYRLEGAELMMGSLFCFAGVIAGFSPVFAMCVWLPGFAQAFWNSVTFMFSTSKKAMYLPLPIPWPWRVDFSSRPAGVVLREILLGNFFLGSLLFGALSLVWVFWRGLGGAELSPVLVAAAFLTLPYAHYSFCRADVDHLSVGIFPPLLGTLALACAQPAGLKWTLLLLLFTSSLWVMRVYQPAWQCRSSGNWVTARVCGDILTIDPAAASEVELLQKLTDELARDGRSFVTVPLWPGAYPLFERRSPLWDIYPLLPRTADFEQAEIERIVRAQPGFVLVADFALDGREELRFLNTHSLTYAFLQERFDRLDGPWPQTFEIYRPKENAPQPGSSFVHSSPS